MMQAMRIMSRQIVMGRTIEEALERAESGAVRGYRYSYDMLGAAARTMPDADRYFEAYADAIRAIGGSANGGGPLPGAGMSAKLAALQPRYEVRPPERVPDDVATPRRAPPGK